jgi:MraZ protein
VGGIVVPLSGKKWDKVGLCGMFLGTFQLKLDDKGRLNIPIRYREILHQKYHSVPQQTDPELILSSIGPRISAYPRSEWEWLADALAEATALPGLHQDARDLYNMLFGNAAECPIDSQGRVLIPPHVRTKVKLNGEVTIIGLNRYFDIWSRPAWEEYQAGLHGREEEVAQKIAELRDVRVLSRPSLFGDGLRPRL